MNQKKQTPAQIGAWKGAAATALLFSVGIAAAAFFLKRKHEAELDKLERDTAVMCLDAAADHYEGALQKHRKQTLQDAAAND